MSYRKRTQDAGHESPEAARNAAAWHEVIRKDKERAYEVFLAWHDLPGNYRASMDFTPRVLSVGNRRGCVDGRGARRVTKKNRRRVSLRRR